MNTAIDSNIFYQALLVNGIIAIISYFAKTVSKSGILGGLIVGIPIYTFMGWQGFVILFSMFAIGTLATKWGYQKKKEMGLAEKNEGKRGISNVLAKCLAGVIFATVGFIFNGYTRIFTEIAFIGSFAAGAFDTTSSEIGQLYGKRCYTIVPFRKAIPGTEGAISLEGTCAGLMGALIIVIIDFLLSNYGGIYLNNQIRAFIIISVSVLLGVFVSNLIESILGSKLESIRIINKFISNFMNTFLGGIFTAVFLIILNR